ncbi:hypothetical protein DM860_004241 [Cuscuta australis]|uniref:Uncharacterized protein n=1 Tax=Cuscuta australis TaxID=267555 RepID=A0A328E872_9ASTE|nr:hypothetical protein DM860_004241 [Cuscuta australis]
MNSSKSQIWTNKEGRREYFFGLKNLFLGYYYKIFGASISNHA